MAKGKKVYFDIHEGKDSLTKNNKPYKWLNPDQRARKYCVELRDKANVYSGEKLTNTQLAYRSGWLANRKQNSIIYAKKKKNKKIKNK